MYVEFWALGISIVALIATLTKDFFIPLLFKPRLEIVIGNNDSFVRTALFGSGEKSRWMRFLIKNKSSFFGARAKRCYIKLLEMRDNNDNLILPFDQAPLPWAVYKDVEEFTSYRNDLSKGESHFIDLVYERNGFPYIIPASLNLPNSLLMKMKNQEVLTPGVYKFKIGIYGDNFKSFTRDIKLSFENVFGKLKYEE